MTAQWMVATTLVSILLAGAAFVLARVGTLYRGMPLRWTWVLAMTSSLLFALLWLRPAPAVPTATLTRAVGDAMTVTSTEAHVPPAAARLAMAVANPTAFRAPRVTVSDVTERGVLLAWMLVSGALLVTLIVTAVRLNAERRQWRAREVANTSVLVSPRFGPAIVGVRRPQIVVPEWVLALDDSAQRAIVAHEEEHRAARDPALLLAGLGAFVLMPWNIGLWMSWRGLRRAIELDCDARVIERGIDGGEYARVLLGAWKSAHGHWMPSTAFAERASGLGARVEHLMRPEPRRRAMRTMTGLIAAAGLIFVACVTPSPQRTETNGIAAYPLVIIDGVKRPELPPRFRFTGAVAVETTTTPTFRILYKGPTRQNTVAAKLYPQPDSIALLQQIDAPASVAHFGEQARYGATLYYTKKYREAGGLVLFPQEGNMSVRAMNPATTQAEIRQIIYKNLFSDITLSPEQQAEALRIIDEESAQQKLVGGPILISWPRRIELNAHRDAQLRALLTSDADRARFDVRSLEGRPKGDVTLDLVAKGIATNFFEGPRITADVRTRAIAIITTAISDETALYRRAPDSYEERLAIRARRDTALRALLPTDSARARFDKIAPRLRDSEVKPQ